MAYRSAKKTRGLVTGNRRLDKKLKEFEPKIQIQIARKELVEVTKKLLVVAGNNLQQAGHVDEGKLLKGLKQRAGKRSRSRIQRVVQTSVRRGDESGFAGAQIELGRKNTEPDSFLRKALYENQKFIQQQVIKGIEKHISKLASDRDALAVREFNL